MDFFWQRDCLTYALLVLPYLGVTQKSFVQQQRTVNVALVIQAFTNWTTIVFVCLSFFFLFLNHSLMAWFTTSCLPPFCLLYFVSPLFYSRLPCNPFGLSNAIYGNFSVHPNQWMWIWRNLHYSAEFSVFTMLIWLLYNQRTNHWHLYSYVLTSPQKYKFWRL